MSRIFSVDCWPGAKLQQVIRINLLLIAISLTSWGQLPQGPEPNFRMPVRKYQTTKVSGRQFFIEEQLLKAEPEVASQALARINNKLDHIFKTLPKPSHSYIRKLKYFILYGPNSLGGGKNNGLEFCNNDAPDTFDKIDRRWSNCIVCYCAKNYTELSDVWAIKSLLHEIAHAYFWYRFSEKHAEVRQAWSNAVSMGLYFSITDELGKNYRAYALNNECEYFAELSVIYFARNSFSPVDREELRSYDPVGYRVIEKLWTSPTIAR